MLRTLRLVAGSFLVAVGATSAAFAQSNAVPGTDIKIGAIGSLKTWGRIGTFPTAVNGVSMSTTACNVGSVPVGWFAPMNTNHPTIAFLFVREEAGRLVQISDRSYVKHGFFATNQSSCGQCPSPGGSGTALRPGCSDTYSTNHNGDQYYLGPPKEIDPWLGTWTSQCSHFDRGEPAVAPPLDCDNIRSLTETQATALGPVGHRVNINDAELDHPAGTFWYQGHYVVATEPEANRGDNTVSRGFIPTWDGSMWTLSPTNAPPLLGSVLQRWSGATVTSNTNGVNDGRLFVAVRVSGPVAGLYHYEFAVHNRDNQRGVGAFRIPVAIGAQVLNAGFRDIDSNAANDWTFTVSGGEIRFATASNPLEWNSLFNFWFDSDAAPVQRNVWLDAFLPGPGAASVLVMSTTPGDPCGMPSIYCTAKVNSLGCTPSIASSGTPSASQGSGFTVRATDMISSTNGMLVYSTTGPLALPFQGGTLCVSPPIRRTTGQNSGGSPPNTDCTGQLQIDFNAWIASGVDPQLAAGTTVNGQFWGRDVHDPTGFGSSLSDAIEFSICP
jgi:hypothetical protein